MTKNVILFAVDQWRADALSCLGPNSAHPAAHTPNLDKLAARSVVFQNHYTVTTPCGPARTALLTGTYSMVNRSTRNGTPLSASITNVAKEVRSAGYTPLLFGYSDTSTDPALHYPDDPKLKSFEGIMPHFDLIAEHNENALFGWAKHLKNHGYEIPEKLSDLYRASDQYQHGFHNEAAMYQAQHSDTAWLCDQIIDYIEFHKDSPWLIHAGMLRPHPPWIAPKPFNDLVDPNSIVMPARQQTKEAEAAQHPFIKAWLEQQDALDHVSLDINIQQISDEELKAISAVYFGLVAEVDAQIGRIIDALEKNNLLEQTMIVFTADHGEQLGEHWLWNKGGYFDASYHIPLIIYDPTLEPENAGRQLDTFTESVDIVPTILEWLNCEVPQEMSGQSLLACIHNKADRHRECVFYEYDFRHPANFYFENKLGLKPDQCVLNVIRDENYKYVHFAAMEPLLFDMKNDPNELNNLAQQSQYQSVVIKYLTKLMNHRMIYGPRAMVNSIITDNGIVSYQGTRE